METGKSSLATQQETNTQSRRQSLHHICHEQWVLSTTVGRAEGRTQEQARLCFPSCVHWLCWFQDHVERVELSLCPETTTGKPTVKEQPLPHAHIHSATRREPGSEGNCELDQEIRAFWASATSEI